MSIEKLVIKGPCRKLLPESMSELVATSGNSYLEKLLLRLVFMPVKKSMSIVVNPCWELLSKARVGTCCQGMRQACCQRRKLTAKSAPGLAAAVDTSRGKLV